MYDVKACALQDLRASACTARTLTHKCCAAPAVQGLHEDSWDSLYMLRHSGQLRAVALSYVAVAGAFNLSGACHCGCSCTHIRAVHAECLFGCSTACRRAQSRNHRPACRRPLAPFTSVPLALQAC